MTTLIRKNSGSLMAYALIFALVLLAILATR
jgi:hypothetical protein